MPKIGRNDPCPCGSGKKYKHCCGKDNNILPFPGPEQEGFYGNQAFSDYEEFVDNYKGPHPPTFMEMIGTPNKATETLNALDKELEGKVFNSNEEAARFIKDYQRRVGQTPLDDFLGLNPEQMHRILYKPFEDNVDLVALAPDIKENDVENIPILMAVRYFLDELQKSGPLKATQKGNLPRKFVQDIYENMYKKYEEFPFKPNKEEDDRLINSHRHILTMAGLVKKHKNHFSLTQKAKAILKDSDVNKLYEILFKTYAQKYNWAAADAYSEFPLIQSSLIFNLFILKNKAKDYIEGQMLGEIFLKAFPDLMIEATLAWKEPAQEIIDCFESRFLKKFCVPFGFVTRKKKSADFHELTYYYKTTGLFDRCLVWGV